jgi:hypothetical protein
MKYIESWLKGLGLEGIIPKLEANGITTPKKLAALSLKDMYEVGTCLNPPLSPSAKVESSTTLTISGSCGTGADL